MDVDVAADCAEPEEEGNICRGVAALDSTSLALCTIYNKNIRLTYFTYLTFAMLLSRLPSETINMTIGNEEEH